MGTSSTLSMCLAHYVSMFEDFFGTVLEVPHGRG